MNNISVIRSDSHLRVSSIQDEFIFVDGRVATTLVIPVKEGDDEWRKITDASINEYEINHNDGYPEDVAVIMTLFACFINRHLEGTVLDVGCGMGAKLPVYARKLNHLNYVGLDPIQYSLEREYPFVCARIEDLIPEFLPRSFNGFIFSTSLDHIRDIRVAGSIVRQLAKPGAHAVFWVGLHDPDLVAIQAGTVVFRRIFRPLSLIRSWGKALAWSLYYFPFMFIKLKTREYRIRKGIVLDQNHFHYFTSDSVRKNLEEYFGDIVEEIPVPGSNSIFLAVKLRI